MTQMHVADYYTKLKTVSPVAFALLDPHIAGMFPERNFKQRPLRWGELYHPFQKLVRQFPIEIKLDAKNIVLTEAQVQKYVVKHAPHVIMPDTNTICFKKKELATLVITDLLMIPYE